MFIVGVFLLIAFVTCCSGVIPSLNSGVAVGRYLFTSLSAVDVSVVLVVVSGFNPANCLSKSLTPCSIFAFVVGEASIFPALISFSVSLASL